MDKKTAVKVGVVIGSIVGSSVPLLWGAGFLSFSSVIFGAIGACVGIYLGYTLGY
jgi:hypothetical protein